MSPRRPIRVLSGIMFFPRGGSAFVVRALARGLVAGGDRVTVLSGSRADLDSGDARRFYDGLDVRPVDFSAALASDAPLDFEAQPGQAPMHPSFEDRPGAPDRVFAVLDDAQLERQVQAWAGELARAGARDCDVLHLHHLTPINEAAARVAPAVPVIGHLHGTEMLMLELIDQGAPEAWRFAARWAERLRQWARRCERLVVGPGGTSRASELLAVPAHKLHELPNGFDPQRFVPMQVDRRALWHEHLVEHPRGWRPGEEPGSISYREEEVRPLQDGPVLLYSGRFTAVKRLELLIRAYKRAQGRFAQRAALVLVGGYPGEWEGEHPAQTIERLGVRDAFLAGWHEQTELPRLLAGADVLVMPSVREHFGQVLVEGMACEVPPIAVRSPGPESIVDDGQTGWLVAPDDEAALADAMVAAVNDPEERARRARQARRAALGRYSWPAIAVQLDALLRDVCGADPAERGGAGARAGGGAGGSGAARPDGASGAAEAAGKAAEVQPAAPGRV